MKRPAFLRAPLVWLTGYAIVGSIMGLFMMLARTPSGSGPSTGSIWSYWF